VQEVETTPDSPFVRMLGDRSIDLDRILGLESREVSFSVELGGGMERATATIRFNSTRGGVRTRTFTIGGEK
jgi:hypothetical protein